MIAGAAFFWGISATAAKFLLNQNVDTLLIVQTRVSISAIFMGGFFLLARPGVLRVPATTLGPCALLGVLGVAGANYTYYSVIKETSVATGILIQYTAPLLVLGYTVVASEERFSAVKLVAALMSVGGCFLAVGAYDRSLLMLTPRSAALGLASVVCFAFLTVYSRRLVTRYGLGTTTFYALASASLFWLVIQPPWVLAAQTVPAATWGGLAILAVTSVLLPHTLFMGGLRHVVPSRAIITSTLEPIVAIGSAAFVLGEYLRSVQVAGAALVLLAVVLLNLRPERSGVSKRSPTEAA